jgi:hypothetical protein
MSDFDKLLDQYREFLDAAILCRGKQTEKFLDNEIRRATKPESILGEAMFDAGFRVTSRVSDVINYIYSKRHVSEEAQALLGPLQEEWTDYQRTIYYHPDVFDRFFTSHTGAATSFDNDNYAIKCFEKKVTLANLCNNELWSLASRSRHGLTMATPLNSANIGQRPAILSRIRFAIMTCERDREKMIEAAAAASRKRDRSAVATSAISLTDQRDILIAETHKKHDERMKQECLSALQVTRQFVVQQAMDAHDVWTNKELVFHKNTMDTIAKLSTHVKTMAAEVTELFVTSRNACLRLAASPHGTDDPVRLQRDYYMKLCNESFDFYVDGIYDAINRAPASGVIMVATALFKEYKKDIQEHADKLVHHMDNESERFIKEQEALLRTTYLSACRSHVSNALRDAHAKFDETLQLINADLAAQPLHDAAHPNKRTVNAVKHIEATLAAQRTASERDARSAENYSHVAINKILQPLGLKCTIQAAVGDRKPTLKVPPIHGRSYQTYFERLRLCVHSDVSIMRDTMYVKFTEVLGARNMTAEERKARTLDAIQSQRRGTRVNDPFNESRFGFHCPKGLKYLEDESAVITRLDLEKMMILSDGGQDAFSSVGILHSYSEYVSEQYVQRVDHLPTTTSFPTPTFASPSPAEEATLYLDWFVDHDSWKTFAGVCSQRVTVLDQDLSHQIPMVSPWIAGAKQAIQQANNSMQPMFKQVCDIFRNIAKAEMLRELAVQSQLV